MKVFLSGAMTAYKDNYTQATQWRNDATDLLSYAGIKTYDPAKNADWNGEDYSFYYDTYQLRNSDIVLAKITSVHSVGTDMELMLAKELGKPVIIVDATGSNLHPWVRACASYITYDLQNAVDHITNFYV